MRALRQEADFVNASEITNDDLKLLLPLDKQLIFLKMNYAKIGDSALDIIGKLRNLRQLQLAQTGITDKSMEAIKNMKNLRSLNLTGTKISAAGLL